MSKKNKLLINDDDDYSNMYNNSSISALLRIPSIAISLREQ